MKYNIIPRTELKVSQICLGTMTFGNQNTEAEAHQQLDMAYDLGVNFLDTAELYAIPSTPENNGLTEKYIGSWLAKPGNKEKMILATKIAGPSRNLSYIRQDCDFSKESLNIALEGSLSRLQTDHIHLYQLHWPERKTNFFSSRGYKHHSDDPWEDNFLEVIENLNSFIKDGKISYWGLSNETPWGLMRCLHLCDTHQLNRCITVQNPYNLLNRLYEVGMAEINMREDIRLIPYSPMAFGWLSGKYHLKTDRPEDRINQFKTMARYNKELSFNAIQKYLDIAQKHDLSLAQMSLAFLNSQDFVASTIIGATNLNQLKENISSVDITLNEAILKEIEEVHEAIPNPAP